jgi:thioredoxin 2
MADTPMLVACPHCHKLNRVARERLGQAPRCGSCHQALFTGRPVALAAATFDAHAARSELPVVVDCWAPWCGPCQQMAPHFEAAAQALEPQVRLAKVDTEAEPGLGARFQVRSIPTLVMLAGGREVARQSGAMGSAQIQAWVRAQLAKV